MRAWLILAFALVGCAHAHPARTVPRTDPALIAEFARLVNRPDGIEAAAAFAVEHRFSKKDWMGPAAAAYGGFLRAEAYATAAEIAWRFDFGREAVAPLFDFQRRRAMIRVGKFLAHRSDDLGRSARLEAVYELKREISIACRYGAGDDAAQTAIADARSFDSAASEAEVLYALLDEGCPVTDEFRDAIIEKAVFWGRVDFAIRHAVRAGWDEERRTRFAWTFFASRRCDSGFKAAAMLDVPRDDFLRMVETSDCEGGSFAIEVTLPRSLADAAFFAAIRGRKFNVAMTVLPLSGLGEDGKAYLFQEALRDGGGVECLKALRFHMDLHDGFMQAAYDLGRYRFVGNFAMTYEWERKAFDKLVEDGKWEDAAEVAQYGTSESFRTEGIVIAFKASMAAHDFAAGRYFVARYGPVKDKPGIVTQEMYDEAKDAWYAKRNKELEASGQKPDPAPHKAKRKRRKAKAKKCPDDDWCVRAE